MEEKNKSKLVKVVPTQIYSRVVGYFRPIDSWNVGKIKEWETRKLLSYPEKLLDA